MFLCIKNVHVYNPDDIGINDILICNEKIIEIAPHIDFNFKDMQIIDGTGKTAIPGLMDQHVHITGGGGESSFKSRIREIDLSDIIKSGVTTIVGLLGTDGTTRSVENLVAKTKALNEEGITAYCLTGSYELPSVTLTNSVMRDVTFINEIIGVKVAITDHRSSAPTKMELSKLAAQVRVAGMMSGKPGIVTMHTGVGKAGLSEVMEIVEETDIPIKHFRPTHVGHLLPDAVRFANMGGKIDFTSGIDTKNTAKQIMDTIPQVPFENITLSSDSNGSQPVWNEKKELIGMGVGKMTTLWETIRNLIIDEHLAPEKAIRIVTEHVAKALEIYPIKGCLQADSDADIVLMDADWQINTVIARGKTMMLDNEIQYYGYYRYE